MAKATIKDLGTVDFDPMLYDHNSYDIWVIAVCDNETGIVTEEEKFISQDDYLEALSIDGREVMEEQDVWGFITVSYDHDDYDCEAVYHVAYVIDNE